MKTLEQLKGAIRNFAAKNHLRALDVQHMFMFERILERLAVSPYAKNFILKGGLLISSMIGIEARTKLEIRLLRQPSNMIIRSYLRIKQFRLWRTP